MTRPAVSDLAERVYGRIPEVLRAADEAQDWPMLRFMSLGADPAANVDEFLDQASALVDPATADPSWLRWLAQHPGVKLPAAISTADARDAIAAAPTGWRAGTRGAIAAAARSVLTGSRYATVHDHSTDGVGGVGTASRWDLLIVTRGSETPDPAAVVPAVIALGAKPAGYTLHHRSYAASWGVLRTGRPAWADWTGASWRDIEETGL